jgi:hypothetical protein
MVLDGYLGSHPLVLYPTKHVDVNPGIHLKPWVNSRDTGDIEQNIQKIKKMSNTDPTKNTTPHVLWGSCF